MFISIYLEEKLTPLHSVSDGRAKHLGYESVVWDITLSSQARSRYSSHAAVLGSKTPRRVPAVLKYLLMIDGYILATDIYVVVFCAVCIRIYYAVLIATPEAVRVLTGSRILTAVYICILAMQ